jgi:hypothetical protein
LLNSFDGIVFYDPIGYAERGPREKGYFEENVRAVVAGKNLSFAIHNFICRVIYWAYSCRHYSTNWKAFLMDGEITA